MRRVYFLCLASVVAEASAQLYVRTQWSSTTPTNIGTQSAAEYRNYWFEVDYYWYIYLDCGITGPKTDANWRSQYGTVSVGCGISEYLPGWQLPAGCYRGTAAASANKGAETASQGAGTSEYCIQDPSTPPPSTEPAEKCDGPTGHNQPCSPILINLSDGPWKLSGVDDPVHFDIDADGLREWITWVGREGSLAFLALDRNGNGVIDDGTELFGTATPLRSGRRASNGFEALREYDDSGDAVIDSADAVWPALLLWVDANHDAVADVGETLHVARSSLIALYTSYRETHRVDVNGNAFRYVALLKTNAGRRAYYDVYFRVAQ